MVIHQTGMTAPVAAGRRYQGFDAIRGAAMSLGVVLHGAVAYMAVPPPNLHSTSLVWITAAIPILGVVLGILIFGNKQIKVDGLLRTRLAETLRRFWFGGWGFDTFYDQVLVRPFVLLAVVNKNDVVDLAFRGTAALARSINRMTARTQTGRLRWYASSMAFGLAVVLFVVLEVL